MALSAKKARYTFADVLTWEENERIEIIEGEAVMMATPARSHQKVCGEIFRQLANYLEGKKYEIYHAPFAVRFFERDGDLPEDVDTLVEPDISVICDKSKLDQYGCKGAGILDRQPGGKDCAGASAGGRKAAAPRGLRTGRCGKGQRP